MKRRKLGHAFGSGVVHISHPFFRKNPKMSGSELETEGWKEGLVAGYTKRGGETYMVSSWRSVFLFLPFLLILFGLFLRLFNLQVVQGASFRALADSNRIKVVIIHAPRGVIYDRNGNVLAENEPGYRLLVPDASHSGQLISELISRGQALQMEVE